MVAVNTSRDAEIVARARAGERSADLAREYGITRQRISMILLAHGVMVRQPCPSCHTVMTRDHKLCYDCGLRQTRAARPKPVLLRDVCGQLMSYRAGCRCDACRAANRAHHARTVTKGPLTHGTVTSYFSYACRCAPCKQAGSAYQRQRLSTALGGPQEARQPSTQGVGDHPTPSSPSQDGDVTSWAAS